jgi:REP element-mobilizing transposase RayT
MSNHIHGIIFLDDVGRGTACRAPTEQFSKPQPGSSPTVIRSYKTATTRRINDLRGTNGELFWQRNYFEHVIRDEKSLQRIRTYTLDNPRHWEMDPENPFDSGKQA